MVVCSQGKEVRIKIYNDMSERQRLVLDLKRKASFEESVSGNSGLSEEVIRIELSFYSRNRKVLEVLYIFLNLFFNRNLDDNRSGCKIKSCK